MSQKLFDPVDHDEMVANWIAEHGECKFTTHEIKEAQVSLDTQPDFSPFWDSRSGQNQLEVIQTLGLTPSTTEYERRQIHHNATRRDTTTKQAADE